MKSHIITLTSIVCFTATTTTALAQEAVETEKKQSAPKLVVGANLGLSSAAFSPQFLNDRYFKGNGGVFARYYFGKHLAVESGFNYGLEVSVIPNYQYVQDGVLHTKRGINRMNSYSVPLQLQYHLLSPESKIRPYFGLGGGIMYQHYTSNLWPAANGGDLWSSNSRTTSFASFTQGVTWQLNKKWQINQSLSIIRDLQGGKPTFDFKVGVGYSIFNK